jgi:hypothetical protein
MEDIVTMLKVLIAFVFFSVNIVAINKIYFKMPTEKAIDVALFLTWLISVFVVFAIVAGQAIIKQ